MRADIYTRKSTADKGRSVGQQEAEARQAAEAHGWVVGEVFADADRSASRYARKPRPGYAELMQHIEAGRCELLILWETSRGSRDLEEWAAFLGLCRRRKVRIHVTSHQRTYDMNHRRDWRTLADEGVNAHDESEEIAERSRRGKRWGAAQGRPASRPLYGYQREYDTTTGEYLRQVEHPERAPIVREIAARIRAGESMRGIARDLNERGVPPIGKEAWQGHRLARIVTNPAYIARRVHQGQDFGPADWPAILDAETYAACVTILRDPSRRTHQGTALRHLLTALPLCGRCDGRMYSHLGNHRFRYTCRSCGSTTIKATALDEFVERMVLERLRSHDGADLFNHSDSKALAAARAKAATLRVRLDDHYAKAADGALSAAGLAAVEARLLPQVEDADAAVRRLATPATLRHLADVDVVGRWSELPVFTRRQVVAALVDPLRVGPAVRGQNVFEPWRLAESRWAGDTRTWGEHWTAAGLAAS